MPSITTRGAASASGLGWNFQSIGGAFFIGTLSTQYFAYLTVDQANSIYVNSQNGPFVLKINKDGVVDWQKNLY